MKAIVICCFFLLSVYAAHGMVIGGNLDNTIPAKDVLENELCTPDQWEGFSTSWYPELDTLALANISYDFQNRKLAVDVDKWVWKDDGCDSKTFSMIFRFDKKKAYFFHDRPDGKNCTVKDLEHDFEEWCVPKDAKCMGPFTIGGSLKINAYRFNYSQSDQADSNIWVYYESSSDGIPVSAKFGSDKVKGVSDFYDITSGIEDPTRFDPPDFCNDVTVTPWRHGHRGDKRSPQFSFWQFPYRV